MTTAAAKRPCLAQRFPWRPAGSNGGQAAVTSAAGRARDALFLDGGAEAAPLAPGPGEDERPGEAEPERESAAPAAPGSRGARPDGLQNLVLLNLNNNRLTYLPPEIQRLQNLECMSLDNNQLRTLPKEFCCLRKLRELHLSHNSITAIPEDIEYLTKLKILILSRNQVANLPDGLCKMKRLRILDVAGNNIQIFPTDMENLELEELYCEDNPLLEKNPVSAIQEEDILTLKELTARFILAQLENKNIYLHRAMQNNLEVQTILSHKRKCAQCGSSFLGMWLECVKFLDVKQQMKTSRNLELLPVRAFLCSYKCFNHRDHGLFGIAVL
nr:leucine-rich repeat-containing protein 69 [Anolis sagrei ordinatus]